MRNRGRKGLNNAGQDRPTDSALTKDGGDPCIPRAGVVHIRGRNEPGDCFRHMPIAASTFNFHFHTDCYRPACSPPFLFFSISIHPSMAPLAPQMPPLTHQKPSDQELDDVSSASSSSSSSSFVPSPPKQRPNHSTSTALAKPTSAVSTAESRLYKHILYPHDPQAYFLHLLQVASNYEQWSEAATILDELQVFFSPFPGVSPQIQTPPLKPPTFPQLYAHTHIGTKTLISDYIDEVVTQLNIICDTESDDFDLKSKYEFFLNVRQSFGRTALLLSGGATLGEYRTFIRPVYAYLF
ncbi:hypothetical protein BC936DRAFT_142425 [Jimgerdemannia flammicorona]|uniref:Triacylglycerol lipase N-terminal domain-containing protein n=1 Tax=Jimgerdemannia flammicorona TaxID=994334 RepID=A0A433A0V6_9FUNG|nr:hypothetical protein BC936DRAFT_142425 [Jimgerdemannia flammicorona]